MKAQAISSDALAAMDNKGGYSGAGSTYAGGGGFAPGFTSQGMSAIMLNTFWDILPPMMQEQALIDYGSYGRQQERTQDQNKVANKFRELIYSIQDGTFGLYLTQNAPGNYTISGTKIGGSKMKYESSFGFAGAIPWALEGAGLLGEMVAGSTAAYYVEKNPEVLFLGYALAEKLATYVYSKGGKQNQWPSNYGPPPTATNTDWSKSDSQLADEAAAKVGDIARGPGTPHNKAKKTYREKRP